MDKENKVGDRITYRYLTEEEKEYLKDVIKPFKDKVLYIGKAYNLDGEYIVIGIYNEPTIDFPNFKKEKYYKGMKFDKEYTLSELGLED